MKRLFNFFTLLLLLLPAGLAAQHVQDITGLWKGEMYVDSIKLHLPYEVLISENKGKLTGYSRVIFFKDGIQGGAEEPGIQDISIKQNGDVVTIEDEGFLEHNFSIKPPKQVKKTMLLTLVVSDTDMVMRGTWSTNRTKYYLVATGTALLSRKNNYKEAALYKRLDTLKLTSKLVINPPAIKPVPIVAITAVPSNKTALPKVQEPLPEPELIIPPIKPVVFSLIAILKKQAPATVRISGPNLETKALYNSLTSTKLIYIPAAVAPVIAVVEKPLPKAVTTPVVAATNKPTPAPVVVAAAPKPTAPPIAAVVVKPKPTTTPVISAPVAVKPTPKTAPTPAPPSVIAKAVVAEKKPVDVLPSPATKPVLDKITSTVVVAPSVTQGAAEIEKRTTKSDQVFYFEQDSLVLTLYDNGEVDGDTVTVLMNGGIIFSKQGLSTKANTKTVYIPVQTDAVNLVMYAESLGEIPPNTGLMIIMDGEKRYEVRFSADLKSNAGIILQRQKNRK